jgi:hypothetical protein
MQRLERRRTWLEAAIVTAVGEVLEFEEPPVIGRLGVEGPTSRIA